MGQEAAQAGPMAVVGDEWHELKYKEGACSALLIS